MKLLNMKMLHLPAIALAALAVATHADAAAAKKKPVKKPEPAKAAAPAQPVVQAALVGGSPWVKICGKNPQGGGKLCMTERAFGLANQPPVMILAVYQAEGKKDAILNLNLPTGLLLRPGYRISIDGGAAEPGGFDYCLPNGCFSRGNLPVPALEKLIKSKALHVSVQRMDGKIVTFNAPTEGFAKAFAGPATDPKELAAAQKKADDMRAALMKKAEQERQQLEAKPGAAPAAPGAPAVPATPVAPAAK